MGEAYPELIERRAYIADRVKREEERFLETLSNGLSLLEQDETLWIGTEDAGLAALRDGGLQSWGIEQGLPGTAMHIVRSGSVDILKMDGDKGHKLAVGHNLIDREYAGR